MLTELIQITQMMMNTCRDDDRADTAIMDTQIGNYDDDDDDDDDAGVDAAIILRTLLNTIGKAASYMYDDNDNVDEER